VRDVDRRARDRRLDERPVFVGVGAIGAVRARTSFYGAEEEHARPSPLYRLVALAKEHNGTLCLCDAYGVAERLGDRVDEAAAEGLDEERAGAVAHLGARLFGDDEVQQRPLLTGLCGLVEAATKEAEKATEAVTEKAAEATEAVKETVKEAAKAVEAVTAPAASTNQ
jgi:hypothetical protein